MILVDLLEVEGYYRFINNIANNAKLRDFKDMEDSYEALLHIPVESFGFVEIKVKGSTTEIIEAYRSLKRANEKPQGELQSKEFNAALDEYMETNVLKDGVEIYNKMSPDQQFTIQEIKKSFKRIKSRK